MKICLFNIADIPAGKANVKDSRLDQVDKITKAKKRTYVQVELVSSDSALDADAIIVPLEARADLILHDLEFIETRLGRAESEAEKAVLAKLKDKLEREEFASGLSLSEEEKKLISSYGLLTVKPVVTAAKEALSDKDALLAQALKDSGYISFFTTGPTDTRAWLVKKGTTAWEAAGAIHSDIQKGFIRAEIISLADFLACGGETPAKQAGKMRLENKDYVMQDTDLAMFRFNK